MCNALAKLVRLATVIPCVPLSHLLTVIDSLCIFSANLSCDNRSLFLCSLITSPIIRLSSFFVFILLSFFYRLIFRSTPCLCVWVHHKFLHEAFFLSFLW